MAKMSGKTCKFFNTDFCKFAETCRFKHAKENCVDKCDRTICDKRHPKPCKYGIKCKRGQSCAYRHQYTEPRGHSTRRRRNQPPPNQDLAHRASWLESVKQCTVL